MTIEIGKDYRHFKHGTVYTAVCRCTHSETQEPMVVYTTGDTNYWVRPVAMFEERVIWPDGVERARFVRVDDPSIAGLG